MASILVNSPVPITLIGGGEATTQDLSEALSFAPRIVAADGGAVLALRAGLMPDAIIGDLDSLAPDTRAEVPKDRLFPIAEQDSTDFDKALRSVAAPWVLGIGFFGHRVDHQLAALTVLVRHLQTACLLLGSHDVVWAAPVNHWICLDLAPGTRVSLFPMAPVTGRSEGLEWPIDGLQFAPSGQIGTSNRALGPVRLWFDQPGMIVLLPRTALPAALAAIDAPDRSGHAGTASANPGPL